MAGGRGGDGLPFVQAGEGACSRWRRHQAPLTGQIAGMTGATATSARWSISRAVPRRYEIFLQRIALTAVIGFITRCSWKSRRPWPRSDDGSGELDPA